MAGRGRDPNRREEEDNNDGWKLLGGLLGAAAGIGIGYGMYRAMQGSTEEQDERSSRTVHSGPPRSPPRTTSYSQPRFSSSGFSFNTSEVNDSIIIAVDATERRGGGLLILPNTEQIYFYSIDWSNIFKFPAQPDKFEMVNALLALEIFESYVKRYRKRGEEEYDQSLLLKTDNTFSTSRMHSGAYPGVGNEEWRKLWRKINETLQSGEFRGEWRFLGGEGSDVHMKMADRLSRNDYSGSSSLPELPPRGGLFDDYGQTNISKTDYAVMHTVAMKVPQDIKL